MSAATTQAARCQVPGCYRFLRDRVAEQQTRRQKGWNAMHQARQTRAVAMGLLLAGSILLASCEQVVTAENYEQITVGMTLGQVEAILGPGQEEASAGVGIGSAGLLERSARDTRRTYVWEESGRQIIITFDDGKVVSKRKSGF